MKWQIIRYFFKSLLYGIVSYCVYYTGEMYFVAPHFSKIEVLNLKGIFVWVILVTVPIFAYYVAKIPRENKGEYDYENGKLVFKEEDHS